MTNRTQFAVVTGASSGIGKELARQFAQHGFDLLIASHGSRITEATTELQRLGVHVTPVQVDLAKAEDVEELYRRIQASGRPVDAIALNAGIGAGGDFVKEVPLSDSLNVVDLNVRSVVQLTKLVAADMVARRQGRILFTSSIASTMPGAFNAVYNASKAFVQSFSQAVRNELKDSGVSVTALMPGATDTDFFNRAGMQDTKLGQSEKDDPAEVAKQGFDALMAGKDHIVAGSLSNKAMAAAAHVLPDTVLADMHRKQSH